MKIAKVIIGVGAVIALVVAIFGVSDFDTPEVRVAFFPNVGHVVPIVGLENKIFEKNLGNGTIETRVFDSGPQAVESLFANSIDMAYVGPSPAINGFIKSDTNNIRILSGAASGGASLIIHPDSDITSFDDFKGKRIAAPQIANSQDVSLRHHIQVNGFTTAEKGGSVFVLNIANPEIYTLFTKGDIDAAWVSEPWATILIEDLGGKRLFHEEDLWPNSEFASVLLIARADFVKENPDIVDAWLESHNEIVQWINSNPNKTSEIFSSFMQRELGQSFPADIIYKAMSNLKITSDPIKSSIDVFAKRADSLGYLGRDGYNLDDLFYNSTLYRIEGKT